MKNSQERYTLTKTNVLVILEFGLKQGPPSSQLQHPLIHITSKHWRR